MIINILSETRELSFVGTERTPWNPERVTLSAFIGAFNARIRAECLNESWFLSLEDAREKVETWRLHYNTERPHGALGTLAPVEFTEARGIS